MSAPFKLECVTVSVDMADFLVESLPLNRHMFDRMMIVTTPEDVETQRVCRYYGVPHAQTDVIRSRWGEFHKAKGINVGLRHLIAADGRDPSSVTAAPSDWVLHLDVDMVLPPRTRELIERADLDKEVLYGIDRFLVPSSDAWRAHQAMPQMQHNDYHVEMDAFALAPRFAGQRMGGYAPPGFFQLWHPRWSGVLTYPEEHSTAARTDVLFASKWWRKQRALLPEIVGYHLQSEDAAQGTNWGGRVTKRFGVEPDESHRHHPRHHRRPPEHHHHEHHHHHPEPPPYCAAQDEDS